MVHNRPKRITFGTSFRQKANRALSPRQKYWLPHAVAWLAGLLLIALFWGFTLRGIEKEQQESEQAAQRALANLSRLTQEHASRTLGAADQALQLIRVDYLRDGHALDLGD